MEVKGKGRVLEVSIPKSGESANGSWKTQTFTIEEVEGQYPKKIAFQIFNDKVQIPIIGEIVTVSANVESKKFNENWFTNITAWKIEKESDTSLPTEHPTQVITEQPLF